MRILISFMVSLVFVQTAYASALSSGFETNHVLYVMYGICLLLLAGLFIQSVALRRVKNNVLKNTADNDKITEEEYALLEDIKKGLENDEFKMHLQFIVDNKNKHIVSAEGLARWEKADGQMVMPGRFIPVMEKYSLMSELDYCMFERACQKLSRWKGTEFNDFTISCNFTRVTISENEFISKIKAISDKYDFDKSKLLIEITEDSIEKNMNMAMDNIFKSKELGFVIALDDIGSGYSSLLNLCEYPLDTVKLDRKMLLKTDEAKGKDLFTGVVSLAHKLELKIVCEGVETDSQNAFVTGSDCDYIQGWYYSKALPEKEAEEFAREYMKSVKKGE